MGFDRGNSFPFEFLNQMEFHLAQNRKENCLHDHIPFNVKGKENIVFSVCPAVISTHKTLCIESYYIKLNLDCNYPFPIDLTEQTEYRLVLNQSENGEYNLISV